MKVGVLVIGRKRLGFDQQWNAIMRQRCVDSLRAIGCDCIAADLTAIDDQTLIAALGKIRAATCECLIVLQPSLGHGQLAMTLMQNWSDPVILWATPERPEGEKVSSCSLVAQHLWGSILRQANHPFELVYGEAPPDLKQAILLARSVTRLRSSKIGLVGAYAPGFIDLAVDPFLMRERLGIQLHPLSLVQFIDRVRAVPENLVKADLDRARSLNLPASGVTTDDFQVNSQCYLALKQLMAEENLDALALQEWPEIPNELGHWPYLAMSRLADEGEIFAMEGDTDGAALLLLAKGAGLGIGFITDWLEHDDRTITIWHPGMAPLSMCERPKARLAKHFNVEKPLVVDAPLKVNQPMTIARLWRCDDEYRMTAFEGRSIAMTRELTGNAATIEVANAAAIFDSLIHEGLPHHVVLFPGSYREAFRRLARMLSIRWIAQAL